MILVEQPIVIIIPTQKGMLKERTSREKNNKECQFRCGTGGSTECVYRILGVYVQARIDAQRRMERLDAEGKEWQPARPCKSPRAVKESEEIGKAVKQPSSALVATKGTANALKKNEESPITGA
jgi:hypothetical protein